jgi:serine/threonine-protein kinase RsbW/stage II sporulation protein AB (anti-sigma F factor)
VLRCEYTWPATPEHVRDARACVAELARRAGAPGSTLEGVRLAVSEAVSNAVVHGYRDCAPGAVTVTAEAFGPRLKVIIADEGCGPAPRTDSPGAGLGLPLIAEVTESMEVSKGQGGQGTVVRMTFELPVALAG